MEIIDENRKIKILNGMAILIDQIKEWYNYISGHVSCLSLGEKKRGMDSYELYGKGDREVKTKIIM